MMAMSPAMLGLTALGLCACAMDTNAEPAGQATMAEANVHEASTRQVAQTTAAAAGDGVRIRVEAANMSPGTYAAHIHTIGRCDPPSFDSAGPHWNPIGRQHGAQNPQGPHKGDLPNLLVGQDGTVTLEYTIPSARFAGGGNAMLDGDGAALVIHARPDDYRTDPSGNSGARIACGVFG